jgi:DNA-binding CsgD family transcriptional regulator
MDDEQFRKLTEKQRACLRLAAEGLQEKEIARRLSTSPGAVKERLRSARQRIGAASSREAGRLFLGWEKASSAYTDRPNAYMRDVGSPETLAHGRSTPPMGAAATVSATGNGSGSAGEIHDRRAVYVIDRPTIGSSFWTTLFPPIGRQPNRLTIRERSLLVLVAVIVLATCGAGAILAFISLSRFLLELSQKGG